MWAAQEGGRWREGGGGIVHSQRHSVSGCKLLQLDSTPTLASYITSDIPCLHVQSVHQLIVCDNHQQWQNCEQISSLIKQPSLCCEGNCVFSSSASEATEFLWLSLSLSAKQSDPFPPPKHSDTRQGQGLSLSPGGSRVRGGGVFSALGVQWESLRPEENTVFPAPRWRIRADQTKEPRLRRQLRSSSRCLALQFRLLLCHNQKLIQGLWR